MEYPKSRKQKAPARVKDDIACDSAVISGDRGTAAMAAAAEKVSRNR